MFLNLYTIYDTVAEVFNKPFADINDASAIRSFSESVKDQAHKNDYVLYHIGGFDDNSGQITADKAPLKLKSGFEVKNENVVPFDSSEYTQDGQPLPEQLKKQSGI